MTTKQSGAGGRKGEAPIILTPDLNESASDRGSESAGATSDVKRFFLVLSSISVHVRELVLDVNMLHELVLASNGFQRFGLTRVSGTLTLFVAVIDSIDN